MNRPGVNGASTDFNRWPFFNWTVSKIESFPFLSLIIYLFFFLSLTINFFDDFRSKNRRTTAAALLNTSSSSSSLGTNFECSSTISSSKKQTTLSMFTKKHSKRKSSKNNNGVNYIINNTNKGNAITSSLNFPSGVLATDDDEEEDAVMENVDVKRRDFGDFSVRLIVLFYFNFFLVWFHAWVSLI